MNNPSFLYELDSTSKKYKCPKCKEKTFVRMRDVKTGNLVDPIYGRCDRENSCSYYLYPKNENNGLSGSSNIPFIPAGPVAPISGNGNGIHPKSQAPAPRVFTPNENHKKQLLEGGTMFHQYCMGLGIPEDHLKAWKVGKYYNKTAFGLADENGILYTIKYVEYDGNGNRLKKPSFPHYIKVPEGVKNMKCLYGLHLYDPNKPAGLIESEKTAVIASFFYPEFNWLATGGNNGVLPEALAPILSNNHYILYLGDNDKAGTDNAIIRTLKDYELKSPQGVEIHIRNPFVEQIEGYDLADFIRDNKEGLTGNLIKDANIILRRRNPEPKKITLKMDVTKGVKTIWLNGVSVGSVGNVFAIVAPAGIGKSQVCEAIATAAINNKVDCLGFRVESPQERPLLYIDGERTHENCNKGLNRIFRRSGPNTPIDEETGIVGIEYRSMVELLNRKYRRKHFENLIADIVPGIVIIDDISCFATNTNNEEEALEISSWLVGLANQYGFSVVVTIHSNPNDPNFKPRGHLGSEFWRIAEALYVLKTADVEQGIKTLTTDFPLTKTRNDRDKNEVFFHWSDEKKMMVSQKFEPKITSVKELSLKGEFEGIFNHSGSSTITGTYILEYYKKTYKKSASTVRSRIRNAIDFGIIKVVGDPKAKPLSYELCKDNPSGLPIIN